jgi:hypothetical protein
MQMRVWMSLIDFIVMVVDHGLGLLESSKHFAIRRTQCQT